MAVHEHSVDRDAGAGSASEVDEMRDEQKYFSKDDRADTNTTFFDSDIDDLKVSHRRKEQLRDALRRNEGVTYFEGNIADTNYRQWNQRERDEEARRMALTFSSRIELSKRARQRVVHIITDVFDLSTFGPYSKEKVILGTVYHVAKEQSDERNLFREHNFRELMDNIAVDERDVTNIHSLVMERLE